MGNLKTGDSKKGDFEKRDAKIRATQKGRNRFCYNGGLLLCVHLKYESNMKYSHENRNFKFKYAIFYFRFEKIQFE